MFGNPDPSRVYLGTFLDKLAELCKDAKISFSLFIDSTNRLNERPPRLAFHTPNFWEVMKNYNDTQRYNASINRIALHSFILFSGNISNIIWPDIREKTVEPIKSRRLKRKDHLERFFPSADYPNLKNKLFRNFLEHFDDRMDAWDETSEHHNLVKGSFDENGINGDATTCKISILID